MGGAVFDFGCGYRRRAGRAAERLRSRKNLHSGFSPLIAAALCSVWIAAVTSETGSK